eukprot:6126459-Pleurochrysis_carterae.AAC.1
MAFASAHIADKRCPLTTAMHKAASSESAASANDVRGRVVCLTRAAVAADVGKKAARELPLRSRPLQAQVRREFLGPRQAVGVVGRVGADDQKPASGER